MLLTVLATIIFVQFGACLQTEYHFLHMKKKLWLFCISLRQDAAKNSNASVFIYAVYKAEALFAFIQEWGTIEIRIKQIYHVNLRANYTSLSYWLLENHYNKSVESHHLS